MVGLSSGAIAQGMKTSSPPADPRCFRFGSYVVDARRRLLWRDGSLVPLTSKAFEILASLLHHRARVVTKEELLEQLWPDTAVGENTLTRHISTLRRALDERPGQHHYILTIPGHGYQFVAEAAELDECPPELNHRAQPLDAEPAGDSPQIAVTEGVVAARSGRSFWRQPYVIAVAAVAAGVGIALLLTLPMRRTFESPPQRLLRQITFDSGLQREPTWSPDGQSVAYASDRLGNSDIWVQALADTNPRRLTHATAEDSQPDWSPDGRWLVFRSERDAGGLYVVSAAGSDERRIASFGYRPRWSPDGSLVLFSSSGHEGGTPRMHVVGLDGGDPQPVRPDLVQGLAALHMAWKSNGGGLSVWGRHAKTGWTFLTAPVLAGPVITSDISAEVERRIAAAGLTLERFWWSPSGRYLFFEGRSQQVRNLWRVTVDPATIAWIDGPDRLTTGTSEDTDMALSADGTRLVFTARNVRTRLWSFPFDATTGQLRGAGQPVTSGGAGEQDADTPDDGSKLVYRTVRGGRHELWERSIIDGRERLLISSTGWVRTRPRWSPDGLRLAYSRSRADPAGQLPEQAVTVLPAGGGEERVLTRPGDLGMVPTDWSPDGRWLVGACRTDPAGPVGTCLMAASNAPIEPRVRVITSHPTKNLFENRFSPDQRWITFLAVDSTDAGVSTIFVMPASGGRWTPVTEGLAYDDKPHWSPDGRILYFVSNREGLFNVWGRHFDGASGTPVGDPFRVTAFGSPRQTISPQLSRMQIAVTADRLFLPIAETSGEVWMLENVDR